MSQGPHSQKSNLLFLGGPKKSIATIEKEGYFKNIALYIINL
jgi:hypothetical protein